MKNNLRFGNIMLRSMTAYVYHSFSLSFGVLVIELQSVNRKHLEVNASLSRELVPLEGEFKKKIAEKVTRGAISLRMYLQMEKVSPLTITPNLPLAKELQKAWQKIARELEIPEARGFDLSFLKEQEGLFSFENVLCENEKFCTEIFGALDKVLKDFVAMKVVEGKALANDIAGRIEGLKVYIAKIAEKMPDASNRLREKLLERLEALVPGMVENEERILREVCVYAEKVDVTEEVTRFHSHIAQFEAMLASEQNCHGKKMEFLLQELLREANTIASKSSDVEVSYAVVEIKSELEKIREQLQNIE